MLRSPVGRSPTCPGRTNALAGVADELLAKDFDSPHFFQRPDRPYHNISFPLSRTCGSGRASNTAPCSPCQSTNPFGGTDRIPAGSHDKPLPVLPTSDVLTCCMRASRASAASSSTAPFFTIRRRRDNRGRQPHLFGFHYPQSHSLAHERFHADAAQLHAHGGIAAAAAASRARVLALDGEFATPEDLVKATLSGPHAAFVRDGCGILRAGFSCRSNSVACTRGWV
jgi:hypothetical protein